MKKILGVLLVVLFMTGCGMNNNASENDENNHNVSVKNTQIEHVDRWSGQKISKHLVELASGVHEVNDATAVVLGRFAIVGIDVNAEIDRSEVGTVKYTVAEALKDDPHGARAIVIADPDITARLRKMNEDIQNGKPLQGIMNELAAISGRLIPEVPADIEEPEPDEATEDPKDKMNDRKAQDLEEIQQEQSKHHKNNNNQN